MPQNPFGGPQPIGVVYITSMERPDAALALAMLYALQQKRESRVASVCVTGSGLQAAIYCDLVGRFFQLGPPRNGNQILPVGLAATDPLPPDPPMVKSAVEGQYERSVKKMHDTSLPEAVIRNGVIFNAEAAMVLSAPATYLAKSLDLLGVKDLYKERLKRLVIVDTGATTRDAAALKRVIAEFPSPIFYCEAETGDSLRFPGERIERDFAWAPAHPIVDAYRAYQRMPYDAPCHDLAAAWYAVHSDDGLLQAGEDRVVRVVTSKKLELIEKFVEYAALKPLAPPPRFRPPSNANSDAAPKPPEKKDR